MDERVTCSICNKEFSKKGIGSHIWRMHGDGVSFRPTKGKTFTHVLTAEGKRAIEEAKRRRYEAKGDLHIELDDDGRLFQKYCAKKYNAKLAGVECHLTYQDYCQLVKDAGLKSSQLGYSGQGYVLARYNDEGNYSVNNCRFITQKANCKERKCSVGYSENLKKAVAKSLEFRKADPEEFSNCIKRGIANSPKIQLKRQYAAKRQAEAELHKDIRYTKEKNSQYGTFWITNDVYNGKWSCDLGDIPKGYRRGRVMGLPTKKFN